MITPICLNDVTSNDDTSTILTFPRLGSTLRVWRTMPMLHGKHITLRPVREADLDAMYAAHVEIRNRGAFFPLGVASRRVP